MRQERMTDSDTALALAERAAPRYTSYPTAPHFQPAVGVEMAGRWLAGLPDNAILSVYLHVPYCRSICTYCGCHTKATLRDEPLAAYGNWLSKEMELLSRATSARRVTSIHWGGGTPSMLGPDRLAMLVEQLGKRFDLSGIVEHAIELDPRLVDGRLANALAEMGVNRVSLGVQDMHRHVQSLIGRVQPQEDVEATISLLREVGIEAINIDLMYGLPRQSAEDVRRTVTWAAGLKPSRLAIFGYAHVPWLKKHQRLIDAAALPGAAERLQQAAVARETLPGIGYRAIGLDHFSLPDDSMAVASRRGMLRRNFQGYTTDVADALLPLGASSIGRLPQGYIQNAPDVGNWSRAIDEGNLAIVRGIALSVDDHARAEVIERLMCDFSVDFGTVAERHFGVADAFDGAIEALDDLVRRGLVVRVQCNVTMTEAGAPFVRLAAAAFDAYLEEGQRRHSMAV